MKNHYSLRKDYAVIHVKACGTELECRIDKEDLQRAKAFGGKWYAHPANGKGKHYVVGKMWDAQGKRLCGISLHRWLMQPHAEKDTHHKDNDGLNNQRANLECLSRAEHFRKHWPIVHRVLTPLSGVAAAAAELGRKGGRSRMNQLTHAQRVELGRKAGRASMAKRKQRRLFLFSYAQQDDPRPLSVMPLAKAAAEMGRRGGVKRMAKLTDAQRTELGRKGGRASAKKRGKKGGNRLWRALSDRERTEEGPET